MSDNKKFAFDDEMEDEPVVSSVIEKKAQKTQQDKISD